MGTNTCGTLKVRMKICRKHACTGSKSTTSPTALKLTMKGAGTKLRTLASDDGGSKSDDEDDEDVDLSKGSSCSGESINSDKVASDDNGYDSYSLAEP